MFTKVNFVINTTQDMLFQNKILISSKQLGVIWIMLHSKIYLVQNDVFYSASKMNCQHVEKIEVSQ